MTTTDQATKAAFSPRSEIKGIPFAEGDALSAPADSAASPEEGAALIRAFLRIEHSSVRAAILELVTRLSQASR